MSTRWAGRWAGADGGQHGARTASMEFLPLAAPAGYDPQAAPAGYIPPATPAGYLSPAASAGYIPPPAPTGWGYALLQLQLGTRMWEDCWGWVDKRLGPVHIRSTAVLRACASLMSLIDTCSPMCSHPCWGSADATSVNQSLIIETRKQLGKGLLHSISNEGLNHWECSMSVTLNSEVLQQVI